MTGTLLFIASGQTSRHIRPQQFGEQLGFRSVLRPVPMSRTGAWMVAYTDDLTDRFVLVVEDESIAAIDIASIISMTGGRVIGPFQSVSQGFGFRRFKHIDAALLDINLNGELVFPLADAIAERGIPIVFVSAHSPATVPPQHRQHRFVQKPYGTLEVIRALKEAISENSNINKRSA